MNRKLLVSLLRKNIEELEMITDGFMEMNEFPPVILKLASRKTEDIQSILDQLSEVKPVVNIIENKTQIAETISVSEQAAVEIATEPEIIATPTPIQEATEIIPVIKKTEVIVPPIEEPVTIEPELTEIVPPIISQPEIEDEIETVDLDTLVENAKFKISSSNDIEFKEELDEVFSMVQTADETKISIETKDAKEISQITKNGEIKLTSDETKKTTIAEKIAPTTISRNEKLSKNDNSFSASLANKKIQDIKQAISIGDRFRFQRELFNGNGEDMNKTLNYINQLATLDEVMSFLSTKYNWDYSNETADDFNQILRRKFN